MQAFEIDLEVAICKYLIWMVSRGYSIAAWESYGRSLNQFESFIREKKVADSEIFTLATLEKFAKEKKRSSSALRAVKNLSRYLFEQKKIKRPIEKEKRRLPDIYEAYLTYFKKIHDVEERRINHIKRVLIPFHDYLTKRKIKLSRLTIEQIDQFFYEFNISFSSETRRTYRYMIKGFLKYLYYEQKILKRNLSVLVVGSPKFEQEKPPKFLRSHEVQRLFDCINLFTPSGLRANAMLHLAYFLGLRLKEICRITLDDIEFSKGEISIPDRKCKNPIKLPLPEDTIKAITAYIVGVRAQSTYRNLFLSLDPPYKPITSNVAGFHLKNIMVKAGLPSTPRWLRHTYAQNLLESEASISEIREMMGHESIRSTQKYLRIHIKLMREVLFDEYV
jgi:site-specific recombinase XerD